MREHGHATAYEELVALASRVDHLMAELEAWLRARERDAASNGAREALQAWRRRRLAVGRRSRALLADLLRDVDL
jgi:hypothetical protein